MVFLGRRVGFFLHEGNFTAWRGRNFSHAMRLEGCKVFCRFSSARLLPLGKRPPSQPVALHSLFLCILISSSKCCVARHSSSKLDSALSPLHFDVPSSKELTLGLPQINLGILSLNRSFAFLHFCIFARCKKYGCAYIIY